MLEHAGDMLGTGRDTQGHVGTCWGCMGVPHHEQEEEWKRLQLVSTSRLEKR